MEELNKKIEILQFAMNVKMQCLQIASGLCHGDPDQTLTNAKKYYDWINENVVGGDVTSA